MSDTEDKQPRQMPLTGEQEDIDELCCWLGENDPKWETTKYEGLERGTHNDLRNLIVRKFGGKVSPSAK